MFFEDLLHPFMVAMKLGNEPDWVFMWWRTSSFRLEIFISRNSIFKYVQRGIPFQENVFDSVLPCSQVVSIQSAFSMQSMEMAFGYIELPSWMMAAAEMNIRITSSFLEVILNNDLMILGS